MPLPLLLLTGSSSDEGMSTRTPLAMARMRTLITKDRTYHRSHIDRLGVGGEMEYVRSKPQATLASRGSREEELFRQWVSGVLHRLWGQVGCTHPSKVHRR